MIGMSYIGYRKPNSIGRRTAELLSRVVGYVDAQNRKVEVLADHLRARTKRLRYDEIARSIYSDATETKLAIIRWIAVQIRSRTIPRSS